MFRPITRDHVDALSARIEEIKKNKQPTGATHRFNPLRETLLKMRRKIGLTYTEIEAELHRIGLEDVTLSEVKNYFRLIGAVKNRAGKKA